eukprot:TRINITY_DN9215_c0_g1_i1.p1 TRINITY_DN9215_c0_g1~~TRINITY_DN9215_c0_g1_i1.p1  ORF type:complete len:247 (+),score=51.03 TRINITY_DN9215_c0_g1_i1:64-804(+)
MSSLDQEPLEDAGTKIEREEDPPKAGDIQHVKNNSGKKNNAVYTPVLSLGDNRYEILERGGNTSVDEEVAGMVSRLVHFVAFEDASECNGDLLLELEEYQKECWDRERTKESSRKGTPAKGKSAKKDATPSKKPPKKIPLEEELYFSTLGLSLASSPTNGFCCSKVDKIPRFTRFSTEASELATSYGSPLLSNGDQDAFSKKLTELQWLQADTLRTEKTYTGKSAQQAPKDPSKDDPPRSRTPPKD